jgi:Cu/Ag efflux pump CusA
MSDIRSLADRVIRPRLLSIGGVSQIAVIGGDIKEYQIQIMPERMRHYNISLNEIMECVEGINNNATGGVLYEYGNEYLIKGDVNTTSIDDLGKAVVRSDNNGTVLIEDIATVAIGNKMPRLGLASERGTPAVLMTVTKQPAVGTIELTKKIESELHSLGKNMPKDMKISTNIFRQSDFIDNSISRFYGVWFF